MIIGVDAGALSEQNISQRTGVFYYALNMLKALSSLDKKNIYYLYGYNDPDKEIKQDFGKNFIFKTIRPVKFWKSFRLPLQLIKDKPDVFLGLSQTLPFMHPEKSITVIHDLAFEFYPQYYPDSKKLSLNTRYAVKSADKLVAVSESTKKDLVSRYGTDKGKIEVIYHGVSEKFKPADRIKTAKIIKKYGIKGDYFLFAGKARKIKNVERLIQAFALFNSGFGGKYELCLAGESSEVNIEGISGIRKLGYVPSDDLSVLYSNAAGLLSPSLYEGFGMTVLEALACGCPVMVSDRGSFAELARDIKITVCPEKIESIVDGIGKIIKINRKKFYPAAVKYSQSFSWQKSADIFLELLNNP